MGLLRDLYHEAQHCLVVNQKTHGQGEYVKFTIMLRTVLLSDYRPAVMQHR